MTTELERLTADMIAKLHRAALGEGAITAMLTDAAHMGADTLREEIRAALVRADEALKEKIAATDELARVTVQRDAAEEIVRASKANRPDGVLSHLEAMRAERDHLLDEVERVGRIADKVKDLERLQHEIIGAMTDAGEFLPEENPTAPGVVAARIEALARKAKSGFTVSRFVQEQREFSSTTFGPGKRTKGIIAHIRKELAEIEEDPSDVGEWIDVAILAFDGAWRAGHSAADVEAALWSKLATNRLRAWPDWRTVGEDVAIEHIRIGGSPARRDATVSPIVEPVITPAHVTARHYAGGEVAMIGDVVKFPHGAGWVVKGFDYDGDPVDADGANWLASVLTLVRRESVGMTDVVTDTDTIPVADAKRLMVDMAQSATDADFPHERGDFENWADVALAKLETATVPTGPRPTMPKIVGAVVVLPSGRTVEEADLSVDVVVEGMDRADRESLALFMCDRWRTWATTGGV